jgi:hypothetical protein
MFGFNVRLPHRRAARLTRLLAKVFGGVQEETPPPRIGVLVIRAWKDREPAPRLIARVSHTADVASDPPTSDMTSSIDEVCDIVRAWLEGITP